MYISHKVWMKGIFKKFKGRNDNFFINFFTFRHEHLSNPTDQNDLGNFNIVGCNLTLDIEQLVKSEFALNCQNSFQ